MTKKKIQFDGMVIQITFDSNSWTGNCFDASGKCIASSSCDTLHQVLCEMASAEDFENPDFSKIIDADFKRYDIFLDAKLAALSPEERKEKYKLFFERLENGTFLQ
jgi:hypothetical protein